MLLPNVVPARSIHRRVPADSRSTTSAGVMCSSADAVSAHELARLARVGEETQDSPCSCVRRERLTTGGAMQLVQGLTQHEVRARQQRGETNAASFRSSR